MTVWDVTRRLWAAPATVVGLLVVLVGVRRVRVHFVDGVIEAHGPVLAWMLTHLTVVPGGVAAMTLGHVVIGRNASVLAATRSHERVHVRQYETWGPAFLPAYGLASAWALARGRHFYWDNPFERAAHADTSDACDSGDVYSRPPGAGSS